MTDIEIRKVVTKQEQRIFLTFPWKIYKNDPLWVPMFIPERKIRMDPDKSTFFKRGYAEFFIAWKNDQPVGTICAAEDEKTNQRRDKKECVFGFFDCINDYEVAKAMFDHVVRWAKNRKLDALFGPFNLDYEDGYGILIEGRDRPPVILCGHTPEYYLGFVERYGFQPARGDNLAFGLEIKDRENDQLKELSEIADRVRKRRNFVIREANFDKWEEEVDNVHYLLNKALAHLPDHIPWQREAAAALVEPFKKIADPQLILMAEDNGKVVGFFPGIPNLNEAFIHVNGLRYPWNYLELIWHMRKQTECIAIKSVLVLPEYWGSGIALLLFDTLIKRIREKGYKWVDLSLTSEENPKTPMLARRFGAEIYKRYRVFRYML